MDRRSVVLAVLALVGLSSKSVALKIQVSRNDVLLDTYTDNNAAFYDRSYQVPAGPVQGILVYSTPRNACQSVQHAPTPNDTNVFAFIEEYLSCPGASESNLESAGYAAMIAFSAYYNSASLLKQGQLPQALFFDISFKNYLVETAITNDTSDLNPNTTVYITIQDDSSLKLEQLFIVFGVILLAALLISIFIFCCSVCWRVVVVKWRTRGLSRWQIRRLPKRKYRKSRDGACETCSICLEEFKEGETVRVLPCDHVFHPKCVDEWLQKWNRTCPLCKSAIKRQGKPLFSGDPESSRLLSESATPSSGHPTDGGDEVDGARGSGHAAGASNYGTMDHTRPLTLVVAVAGGHKRSTSGGSSSSSSVRGSRRRSDRQLSKPTSAASKQEPTTSVATLELNVTSSGETSRSATNSPSPSTSPRQFHTPHHSDDEGDGNKELSPSFRTANGENESMSSSVRV